MINNKPMNIAIILSGGTGSRMKSDIPKQYMLVNGKTILSYSLTTFLCNKMIDAVIITCTDDWKSYVEDIVGEMNAIKPIYYAPSGKTRQYSIYNALVVSKQYCNSEDDIVIIHDAARPLISNNLIEGCIKDCEGFDGVMPVIPVKDTIYQSMDGKVIECLLDRNKLWCGQAPEAFRLKKYLEVHETMPSEELMKINGSTEIAFKAGLRCRMIEGDTMNFKITSPEDLDCFKSIIMNKK